ncbi:hypothetical protein LX32DRAFT_652988 [Colletotrichum zoysiae]|uniref:Secreted protein n=1 Tax=Colletotrichum zoysiae TaxID=1216348 RepID=A0AAD9M4Z0_9PEZI|nr:hypothetical protein LX32DRAFT_652988 [Colletotrichum zoysiae]
MSGKSSRLSVCLSVCLSLPVWLHLDVRVSSLVCLLFRAVQVQSSPVQSLQTDPLEFRFHTIIGRLLRQRKCLTLFTIGDSYSRQRQKGRPQTPLSQVVSGYR